MLWLANNLIVGSIGGSLLEATIAATNYWMIWRTYRKGSDSQNSN